MGGCLIGFQLDKASSITARYNWASELAGQNRWTSHLKEQRLKAQPFCIWTNYKHSINQRVSEPLVNAGNLLSFAALIPPER